jgi:hypothetical protein
LNPGVLKSGLINLQKYLISSNNKIEFDIGAWIFENKYLLYILQLS